MVALRFAYKKTRSHGRAQDLVGRVNLRLVRRGWDPRDVTLVKRMCRLVWSEYTARAVDPGGDETPPVKATRDRATHGILEKPKP
jgi:hypothetical protein